MIKSDDNNLMLVESIASVDKLNAEFYGLFPYPWPAVKFDYLQDPYFETVLLNQDVGVWQHDRLPEKPAIWVAGCGTNQAVFTALRFPQARVVGSDVSVASLNICSGTAQQLGISNLELRQESINGIQYQNQFDYIISTGVIHHNADPQATLEKIAAALKPSGILELMVYNRFHWTIPAAFQKAIRILGRDGSAASFESELDLAKEIIGELPQETLIGVISKYRDCSDAMLADELLQPVLHHYTVESLADMATNCGLQIILPCLNQFDKVERKLSWNMEFQSATLSEIYDSLPDLRRWQVTNLLLRERSPQLWFYLQRKDSKYECKSEKQVCEEFLSATFAKARTTQRGFIQGQDGKYKLLSESISFPALAPDASVKKIYDEADGRRTIKEIFQELNLETTFAAVNKARIMLATSAFPYLKVVGTSRSAVGEISQVDDSDDREKINRAEKKLKKFKSIKPVAVSFAQTEICTTSYLQPNQTLPLVIQPATAEVDLAEWASSSREFIETRLAQHGALLFRDFQVGSALSLERFALTLCSELVNDNGEHQRSNVSRNVYTPVFYPAEQQLLWHNENSFNYRWPTRIWFCCIEPAMRGGETPIVDSRLVYAELNERVRERFLAKGVKYVRNYGTGLGLDWQTVFQTENREEVERQCRHEGIEFEWKGRDQLRTSCVRPAALKHPVTGQMAWFNQAQHWHVSCLDRATRESALSLFKEEDLPRHCYFGDGTSIEASEMEEILETYRRHEVTFAWQRGDVMMLDNILTAHARNSFVGERQLLVTMGDMLSYADLDGEPSLKSA
jgi:SAM-dependent methyltransferase/alpha-ketoglutarate-dependent taurine dioxygenase